MDATFRADLMRGARAATDTATAHAFIEGQIAQRRHLTQHLATPASAPTPGPWDYLSRESRGGVQVPAGDTSAPRTVPVPADNSFMDLASDFDLH
ncbi:hypothetical protein [Deinococcus multiflagellatus]|uniref:Uncharacterized protein n=2 Tax=Deinococcus multiflagellatus TaxID=1656887 RepID=A0ABW1ZTV9_9DEIO